MNRIIVSTFAFTMIFSTMAQAENPTKLTAMEVNPDQTDGRAQLSLAPIQQLLLTQEWDKVFPKSDKVDHRKVTFVNRYGITLAADMYTPNLRPSGHHTIR